MLKGAIVLVAAAAVLVTLPAQAKSAKHAKHKAAQLLRVASQPSSVHRGANLFPAGPLYWNGGLYMGDDPDPFIRFQLWRDIGGRLGGESN